jgi:hypothetical protein
MAAGLRKAGAERCFSIRQTSLLLLASGGKARVGRGHKFILIHSLKRSDIVRSRILPRAVPPVGVTSLS